jgi:16S rRNA (cytosine967-C5)-methyltransferase
MIPAARTQAVVELLGAVEDSLARKGAAADAVLKSYFAKRRYAGSKDRAAVSDMLYRILRHRSRLTAGLKIAGAEATPRLMVLADHVLLSHSPDDDIAALFSGGKFAPEALSDQEQAIVQRLRSVNQDHLPRHARLEYPEWMEGLLEARFGEAFEGELAAIDERAPVTIRANGLKIDRDALRENLDGEGIVTTHCRYALEGLVVEDGKGLTGTKTFKDGLFEVQDEGAQLAAILAEVEPSSQVLDLCAGAGGKALALAAVMGNSGQLFAADVDARRLDELKRRAKRAGAHNVQPILLPEEGDGRSGRLAELEGRMDRVILDVPCTGTGTWRRNPELRWRFGPEDLDRVTALQARLLDEAAPLVRPGGRIVYVTCSLLPPENEDQIRAFLERHDGFKCMEYELLLPDAVSGLPASLASLPGTLCMTPATHGTDGFFVAVLARK